MFARCSLMATARARKISSSLSWYFCWHAFTDSASIRACAGSYTPHGRSQCAWTLRRGLSKDSSMGMPPSDEPSGWETYHRGGKRVAGVAVGVGVLVAALRWRPFRVEIDGASMLPTLFPGDWALAVAARRI